MKSRTTMYNPATKIAYIQEPRTVINQETGEIQEFIDVKKKVYGSKRFVRLYSEAYKILCNALETKAHDTLQEIFDSMNPRNNEYIGTYQELQVAVGMSATTVCNVMAELQRRDLIRKIRNGRWMVNPTIACGCYEEERERLIERYISLPYFGGKQNEEGRNDDESRADTCEPSANAGC